ncbi:metallophosphoesterase [Nodosilinea sp. LEGE 06152]|uniref:metallophosphoesterase family protein n=1 Tax=Nodosilinea sp. LEGE 06152 TaxID=2777966 RepID=UPI0018816F4B|nr:metallophosphoesterase [Nodosilinea sp. LEGE 06152]MBE9156700.1 metallophosphoesterase [Nodosilinea sp. LEGE 06152]
MGYQRFLMGLCLGLVLSVSIACSQRVLLSKSAVQTPPNAVTEEISPDQAREGAAATVEASAPVAADLSATAQAWIANAPGGMINPTRKDVRLVAISDLNSAYGSTDYEPEVDKAIALLPYWQPDLVVCGGDMVAGQKASLTPEQIRAMWQAFDDHVAAPLREQNIPFGFTIGNHDASGARSPNNTFLFQQERDLATAYWTAPEHSSGVNFIDRTDFPFYYTFEQQGIFFMAWDGSSSQIPTDKLAWVEQALASDAAQQAKARILISHLPLYGVAVGRDRPGEVMANADQLQAMLERHNVHTYISGHQHAYYPGHRGQLQLLHTGILGAGPRPLIDSSLPPWKVLTVIDVDFNDPELTTYTTYDIQTLRTIEYDELPRFLAGHNGVVLRRDISYDDLAPDEKSFCEQRLGKSLCTGSLPFPRPRTYAA